MKESTKDGLTNLAIGAVAVAAGVFCVMAMNNAYAATKVAAESAEITSELQNMKNGLQFIGSMIGAGLSFLVAAGSLNNLIGNIKGYSDRDLENF